MRRWRVVRLLLYLSSLRHGSRVLQIMENELCRKHRNHKKTLSWPPRKFVYCCPFNHNFLCANHFIFNKGYFIQAVFKNIQGLLWKIQGLFKYIQQFFNFQGLFKDMMLFQGPYESCSRRQTPKALLVPAFIYFLIWLFIRRISVLNRQLVPVIPKVSVLRLI